VLLRKAEGFFTGQQLRRVRAQTHQAEGFCSEFVREGERDPQSHQKRIGGASTTVAVMAMLLETDERRRRDQDD
jgi:hypothetical protein